VLVGAARLETQGARRRQEVDLDATTTRAPLNGEEKWCAGNMAGSGNTGSRRELRRLSAPASQKEIITLVSVPGAHPSGSSPAAPAAGTPHRARRSPPAVARSRRGARLHG